jgi:hypothetical protein
MGVGLFAVFKTHAPPMLHEFSILYKGTNQRLGLPTLKVQNTGHVFIPSPPLPSPPPSPPLPLPSLPSLLPSPSPSPLLPFPALDAPLPGRVRRGRPLGSGGPGVSPPENF